MGSRAMPAENAWTLTWASALLPAASVTRTVTVP